MEAGMVKKIFLLLTTGAFIATITASAMAIGLGGYMTLGGGSAKYHFSEFEYYSSTNMSDSSNLAVGGGFVLDTNAAGNQLFNYRLKIGGERNWVKREADMKLSRLHLQNVFGFGVVRTKWVRFWLGPGLGGSYTWGDRDSDRYFAGIFNPNFIWQTAFLGSYGFVPQADLMRDRITNMIYGGIDFGFVVGLNINIGDYVTLGPELGFKYAFNWGSQNREVYWCTVTPILFLIPVNIGEEKKTLTLHGYEIYMNFSVMCRVGGDTFRG
jgi:hypothetical protein